ncbi:MAG: hypothetical protein ABEJ34_01710 [Haloferacaceae archaeon]
MPDWGDDRAVSTALGYVLLLAVAALLVSGLLAATGTFIDGQRDSTVREGLSVSGQQAAGAIETADRLVRSSDATPSTLVVQQRLPRRIAGTGYTIEVNVTGTDVTLELSPAVPGALSSDTVTVPVSNRTAVAETSIQGGTIEVRFDGGKLEVSSGV